ncbi:CGNR zinc finger domain-containing protein [Gryllotalpicola protaetiae]|nr:CGNR zinc finger domain-containing protein [Gryllotalpicola protaetiae]
MTTFRSGNGAAWLDLLSTREGRYREAVRHADRISAPDTLLAWLAANDLEPTSAVTPDDVELFGAVREALHRAAVSALHHEPASAEDIRILSGALGADRGVRIERAAAGLSLARPDTAREALGRLTRAAVEDLAGPRSEQLHACGDDTCAGIFFDPTGRRRWCTDQSCGNRLRVRAHRNRTRQSS